MWKWVVSEEGQAVAAWGADILAVVALAAALIVALHEQRRANRELLREAGRERERRETFIAAALSISDEAVAIVNAGLSAINPAPESGVSPTDQNTVAYSIRPKLLPLHDAARSLQQAAPLDAGIAVSLARICRAIENSWNDTAAYQGGLIEVHKAQLATIASAQAALRRELLL